ncbi:MAG: hypothetical protein IT385_20200 [Deltaproteobacteria bacterium]|nr:hypothetical protein [Deltaproteobacteria bacterium]
MKRVMESKLTVLGLIAAALTLFGACTESAEVRFDFTSQARPTRSVTIDNFEGSVKITKGQVGSAVTGRVRVVAAGFDKEAQARDAAAQVTISEAGTAEDLELVVLVPQTRGAKTFDVDMDLTVPDGVLVNVTTDHGSIAVDSLPIGTLDTTDGPITTRFTSGEATLRTEGFPITMESHVGDVDVRTSSAPIELISVAGNARATTTLGHVSARVTPPTGGEVFIATTASPVELITPREFGARLLAVTSGQGLVVVEGLPFTPRASPPFQAEGTIGNGAGIIDVRTTDADIVVQGR